MNKLLKRFIYIVSISVAIIAAGCTDDIDPESTSLDVSRLFSPVDLDARIVNQTSVRLEWKEVKKAQHYNIEVHQNATENYSGTPFKTVTGVLYGQLPYVIPGFAGETTYSVRVQAVGESISDSKWTSTTFTTNPEQIFLPVDPEEITATGVTVRWPAGETATSIVLTPGNITRPVTANEIATGIAIITGLTSETAYTAKLMNGNATRGTVSFTTLLDLGGAIAVYPEDDLTAILQSASEGDVFALLPGTYSTQDIAVSKTIAIKGARPTEKPVLMGTIFRMKDGAGLDLKDLILDGTGSANGNQTIIYDTALPGDTYDPLKIEDCILRNYTKGTLYVNVAALIESVTIKGTIYYNIECNGGDFIDFRNGMAKTFDYTNNTAYNSALARDFFRMDAGGSTNFPGIMNTINISNNTFNNVSNGSSRRILYIRLALNQITCNKNIFANTEGYYSNQGATNIVAMSNNNYFNAPNFTGSAVSNAKNDTGTYTTLNPGFVNAAEGNFKVTNEELIFNGIGDPRWLQ